MAGLLWPHDDFSSPASEVNLVDRRWSSLSRSERLPFSSLVDSTFNINIQKQNFLSPEFKTKFQTEVPLFWGISEFPFHTV